MNENELKNELAEKNKQIQKLETKYYDLLLKFTQSDVPELKKQLEDCQTELNYMTTQFDAKCKAYNKLLQIYQEVQPTSNHTKGTRSDEKSELIEEIKEYCDGIFWYDMNDYFSLINCLDSLLKKYKT